MSSISHFFLSHHVLALFVTLFIFLVTIFLVVKRWIGFSIATLLLTFALLAGLIINYQSNVHDYLNSTSVVNEDEQDNFHKQVLQAVEALKTEVNTEKESLKRVAQQVQEVFNSVEVQKQKLQNFIEEARDHFKVDHSKSGSSSSSEELKSDPDVKELEPVL